MWRTGARTLAEVVLRHDVARTSSNACGLSFYTSATTPVIPILVTSLDTLCTSNTAQFYFSALPRNE